MRNISLSKLNLKITNDMIEEQVQHDLAEYQRKTKKRLIFPIYPEEIALELWGVEVVFQDSVKDLSNKQVYACFDTDNKKIYFNNSLAENKGQASFTLAHEVGHVSLHRLIGRSDRTGLVCVALTSTEQQAERHADKYASLLLMPTTFIMEQLELQNKKPGDILDIREISTSLRSYFGVSQHALENRLIELGFRLSNPFYSHKSKKYFDSDYVSDLTRGEWAVEKS